MSPIRTPIALRALPVSMVAGGVDSVAQEGLDCLGSPTPRTNTTTPRRHCDGIAIQN